MPKLQPEFIENYKRLHPEEFKKKFPYGYPPPRNVQQLFIREGCSVTVLYPDEPPRNRIPDTYYDVLPHRMSIRKYPFAWRTPASILGPKPKPKL